MALQPGVVVRVGVEVSSMTAHARQKHAWR